MGIVFTWGLGLGLSGPGSAPGRPKNPLETEPRCLCPSVPVSVCACVHQCLSVCAWAREPQHLLPKGRAGGGRARPWGVHIALAREGHGNQLSSHCAERESSPHTLLPPDCFAGPQLPEAVLTSPQPAGWRPDSPLHTHWRLPCGLSQSLGAAAADMPGLAVRTDSWWPPRLLLGSFP